MIGTGLDEREIDAENVDHYVDLGHSVPDPDREQFRELIDSIEPGQYEYVVVWMLSLLARLVGIYQCFFETCEDARTTRVTV